MSDDYRRDAEGNPWGRDGERLGHEDDTGRVTDKFGETQGRRESDGGYVTPAGTLHDSVTEVLNLPAYDVAAPSRARRSGRPRGRGLRWFIPLAAVGLILSLILFGLYASVMPRIKEPESPTFRPNEQATTGASQLAATPTTAMRQALPQAPATAVLATAAPPPTQWLSVANTDGEGVILRRSPQMADKVDTWPDGTKLEVIGPDTEGGGHRWKQVRDPKGQVGYVSAEYVVGSLLPSGFRPDRLEGAYRRTDGTLYGRPAVALYGVGSTHDQGTFRFNLDSTPSGKITLGLLGLDDERREHCRVQVLINGTIVFDGESPFPNVPRGDIGIGGQSRYWAQMRVEVPANVLRTGANTLTLRNLVPWTGELGVPYILVTDLDFTIGQ